jgi:hypothetical protein
MNKKIFGISVSIMFLILLIPAGGATIGNNIIRCELKNTNSYGQAELGISERSYNEIISLFNEIQQIIKNDYSAIKLQEKTKALAYKLEEAGLISKDSLLFKRLTRESIDHSTNFLNLVIGFGKETKCVCPKDDLVTILYLILDTIEATLYNLDIIDVYQHFSLMDNLYEMYRYLIYSRPKALFALGFWAALSDGWGATIGLNGIHYTDNCGQMNLLGFAGLTVNSYDNDHEYGFIIGFSLISELNPY